MGVKRSIPSSEGFSRAFSKPEQKISTKHFLLLKNTNDLSFARIGVAVRKKDIKLAVHRNKIKRQIKGSFAIRSSALPAFDYVVLVKKNITLSGSLVKEELEKLWKKLEHNK